MSLLKNSPLAVSCLIAIAVMAFSTLFHPTFALVMIIVCFILAFIFFSFGRAFAIKSKSFKNDPKKLFTYIAITLTMVSLLLSSGFDFYNIDLGIAKKYDQHYVTVRGEVESVDRNTGYFSSVTVRLTKINEQNVGVRAVIEFESRSPVRVGDKFILDGFSSMLSDEDKHLLSKGCALEITPTNEYNITKVGKVSEKKWISLFERVNELAQKELDKRTTPETADLTGAMLLGNREELGDKILRDFRRSGISHMLALSGLHVSIIIGLIDLVLNKLGIKKIFRCFALIAGAVLFLIITGFSLSAARAVIMACFVYISYILSTEPDGITSLLLSAFLIILFSPTALVDVGFWMSFLATLGVIVANQILSPLHFRLKKKHILIQIAVKLLSAISITVAATVATSAFSWLIFGEISLISILSNLIFSIPAGLVLTLGLLLLIFSGIPYITEAISYLLDLTVSIFREGTAILSSIDNVTVSMRYEFVKYIIPTMLLLTLILLLLKLKRKWLVALPTVAAIMAFFVCVTVYNHTNDGVVKVTYYKNQSSEILTVSDGKSATICDASHGGFSNLYEAYEILSYEYNTEIENIILTHYHQFHPNALIRMCEKQMVRKIFLPCPEDDSDESNYWLIVSALENTETRVITYRPGDLLNIGENASVRISEYVYIERSVHPMYSVTVESGGESVIYFASSMYESEGFNYNMYGHEYLIFGGHGPKIRSEIDFSRLKTNKNAKLILSDAKKQCSDAPLGVPVIRTDEKDTVKIIIDERT